MITVVYTTTGGARFHEDSGCLGLAGGLRLSGGRYSPQGVRYKVRALWSGDAALLGFTACRVCVPPAQALPATGETHGHEPVSAYYGAHVGERTECARCTERRKDGRNRWVYRSMPWPCTSAVVLGLVARGGA